MKSSGPVFTRKNPFPPASTGKKAHYHPSRNQSLPKKEKKPTLSPVNQRSSPQLHPLSPEGRQLDKKHDQRLSAFDGQPVLTEPWPPTDCGSSPGSNTASSDFEASKKSARAGKSTALEIQEDSVLAKYVERFRHGRPQSREERQQMAPGEEQMPFWWMPHSSLPLCSTPTQTTDEDVIQPLKDDHDLAIYSPTGQRRHDGSLSPWRRSLSILSDTSQGEFDDTEIVPLQQRASRLLLRGECTPSDGSVPVSSEGLGGSDFSSPVSVDEPARRPLIPSLIKPTTGKAISSSGHAVSSQKSIITSSIPPSRPEEDILFQWRLRRKMEQAREWPQSLQPSIHGSTFSWQAPSLSHTSASDKQSTQPPQFPQRDTHPHMTAPLPETEETHRLCPPAPGPPPLPAFVVSQPQTIAHVPAHMHLLCDVLPCPVQSSHAILQQGISQRLDDSQTKAVHKKTQIPDNSTNTFSDVPLGEHMPFPASASSGAVQRERPGNQRIPERNKKAETKESEKKTAVSIRQQKKSASSSHQRLPKKVTPWKEQHRQEGSQDFSRERCTVDHEPPPSPIHSALGQVVSEVLFPTVDSSPAQRIPASSVSPPCSVSAPSQSPDPPCNAQNSMEVISQLLQEAEDSDETEFEADPLLHVLRKQRKWVKEQISEVDSVLNEFPEEEHVT